MVGGAFAIGTKTKKKKKTNVWRFEWFLTFELIKFLELFHGAF